MSTIALQLLRLCLSAFVLSIVLERGLAEEITCTSPSPNGSRVAVGTSEGRVHVVDLEGPKVVRTTKYGGGSVARLAWSPNGERLAIASFRAHYGWNPDANWSHIESPAMWRAVDAGTGETSFSSPSVEPGLHDPGLAWNAASTLLATWGCDPGVDVWDVARDERVARLSSADEPDVTAVAWLAGRDELGVADATGRVRLFDARTGKVIHSREVMPHAIYCLESGPESLFFGSLECKLGRLSSTKLEAVWSGRVIGDWLFPDVDRISSLDIHVQSELVAVTTQSWGTVGVYSLEKGTPLWMHDLKVGNDARLSVTFDPAGLRVASWGLGLDRAAMVFSSRSGAILKKLDADAPRGGRGSVFWTSNGAHFLARSKRLHVRDGRMLEPEFDLALEGGSLASVDYRSR